MPTRTRKHRSHLAAALCALTASVSLVPATAGAVRHTASIADHDRRPVGPHESETRSHLEPRKRQLQAAQAIRSLTARASFYRSKTWYLEQVMGVPLTRHVPAPRSVSSARAAHETLGFWRRQAASTWKRFSDPPNYSNWLCIQRNETAPPYPAWKTASGNGYFGGVQMDRTFMRHYGAFLLRLKGTANNWTKLEQIWVAERGRRVQGWGAWPRSSHACGLT